MCATLLQTTHRSLLLLVWMCYELRACVCVCVSYAANTVQLYDIRRSLVNCVIVFLALLQVSLELYYCFVCNMNESMEGAATEAIKTYVKTKIIGATAGWMGCTDLLCTNHRCSKLKCIITPDTYKLQPNRHNWWETGQEGKKQTLEKRCCCWFLIFFSCVKAER